MNLPAASGRGILIDQLFPYRPKGRGIKPEEIERCPSGATRSGVSLKGLVIILFRMIASNLTYFSSSFDFREKSDGPEQA